MKSLTLLGAIAIASLATACGTSTSASVSSVQGIGFSTSPLSRADYVIMGDAKGEACAEETCVAFFGCTKKAGSAAGEDLLEGRLNSDNVDNVNMRGGSTGDLDFFTALMNALFGGGDEGGPSDSELAERIALYKAIESVPDADAIIQPRKSIQVTTTADLFGNGKKSCVKVKGKAIRFKTDVELAATTAGTTTTAGSVSAPAPTAPVSP